MLSTRDIGIRYISEGTNKYNESANYNDKKLGYNMYIKGIETLIAAAKQETNDEIKKLLKEKISNYTDTATQMKQELDGIAQPEPPKNNLKIQPNQNSNNKSNIKDGNKSPTSNSNNTSKIKEGNAEEDKLKNGLSEAIITEKPNVRWEDVAGLHQAKKSLQEAVILPIKFPQIFTGSRKPWKGILLYGPPGTGKTFLAKACATEADGTFFSLSSSDLISKWVGESEKLIKTLFKMAREQKPSIIFIDEIDSLAGNRSDGENDATRRVKTELLVQMQGVGKEDDGILVLGATNIPWGLDPAVRRRFEKRIYIPLPDFEARLFLFKNQLTKTPNGLNDEDYDYLATNTEGFSGSDISVLIRDASFQPLRKCERATTFKEVKDNKGKIRYEPCAPSDPSGVKKHFMDLTGDQLKLPDVDIDDFNAVLSKCKPSVSPDDLKKQVEFTEKFGQDG